jgi:hypothetical protein
MEKQNVATYMGSGSGPFTPDSLQCLEQTRSNSDPEPFSNLFDRNINSLAHNPDATLGSHIGLTEFTNANFFSDDTIPFQPFLNFPGYNPSKS